MIGLEIFNGKGDLQLRDDLETMCLHRKVEDFELGLEERILFPTVNTLNGSYSVAPISKVDYPKSGAGLEIFGADGKIKFSSLAKFISFAGEYNVTWENTGTGEFRFNGISGHRYGWIQQQGDRYLHYRNIRRYLDPFDFEYYYEADVYSEGYSYVDDKDGLTIKYIYEFIAHIDSYIDTPPSREGTGRFLQGIIIDISMLDT
ncbi:hypothetical protein [Providencia stuartii]|uniref:hypothetical protein n=1 Tax=Providencia stuartii TaxID=588 RepID=UPI00090C59E4|nr:MULTISPECIES: hypothetical protein [Providencia]APG49431.1 hypothetical protein BGK56_00025 [Providencia stuartii]APG50229.1 hypothetical protein BGK56_04385 [Providencia stuartii]AVL39295.1 hypothetical protein CEP70_04405 [Providencia stuartii]AVL39441.1 hypothetical protein CEP70_05250 [Providencia stuartii]EMA3642805.1 hypothetical protein [Providencia stuartii]